MNKLDRRSFLKSSLLTTASLSLFPALGADQNANPKAPAPAASRPLAPMAISASRSSALAGAARTT